jgi:putative ABC transport system permease protein
VARFVRSIQVGGSMLPIRIDMRLDFRVALFASAVGLASGILSGIIPAIRCSRGDLNQLMRSADPRATRSWTSFRQILVAAQVTLATVVLVVSGLSLQALSLLRRADPGFRVDNVLTMALSPTTSRGFSVAQAHQFYEQLIERVRNLPGVESAALGHHVPLGIMSRSVDVAIEGYVTPPGQQSILRGRAFDARRDRPDAPKTAIINEAMAEKYWPGRDAIGKQIDIQTPQPVRVEVVGIARTAKYLKAEELSLPFVYLPFEQTDETFMYLFVATRGDPASFVPVLRNAVRELDPSQPVYDIHTMTEKVRWMALWGQTLAAQIATSAAVAALLLGVLGLYGMLAYSVSRRTREIGIRMAVGATTRRVSCMIVTQGLKLSIGGIVSGLILAEALVSAIPEVFTPANPHDPVIYGVVVAVVLAVTFTVLLLPGAPGGTSRSERVPALRVGIASDRTPSSS